MAAKPVRLVMSNESIISLLIGIPLGVISGVFSGLLVARYQRFAELRFQSKKIVLEIDFIWEGDRMNFPGRSTASDFSPIVSDLLFLKHRRAAGVLLRLYSEVASSIQGAQAGSIGYEEFERLYISWQQSIRAMSPNLFQLVRLWGGL
jgi:hypothetical protein